MRAYDSTLYQAARAELVSEPGHCFWCGAELGAGEGDADHLGGLGDPRLVRSCRHCNRGRERRGIPSPGSASFFR